jgi:hypothetical protein
MRNELKAIKGECIETMDMNVSVKAALLDGWIPIDCSVYWISSVRTAWALILTKETASDGHHQKKSKGAPPPLDALARRPAASKRGRI